MSDIIPSEFEANNNETENSEDSGNIMDEECKESVGQEGGIDTVSHEYGDINQTVVKGAMNGLS